MDNAKIIAVDFDGTLVENKWPEIGAPIEKNISDGQVHSVARCSDE